MGIDVDLPARAHAGDNSWRGRLQGREEPGRAVGDQVRNPLGPTIAPDPFDHVPEPAVQLGDIRELGVQRAELTAGDHEAGAAGVQTRQAQLAQVFDGVVCSARPPASAY